LLSELQLLLRFAGYTLAFYRLSNP
jgi:hypothetical protein